VKTKSHHPHQGREKGGDPQVVQERDGDGTFKEKNLFLAPQLYVNFKFAPQLLNTFQTGAVHCRAVFM